MASHQLPIVPGQADCSTTFSVTEAILAGLDIFPFLGVPNRDLTELSGIRKDLDIGRISKFWIVCCRAKILETPGLGQSIQLAE